MKIHHLIFLAVTLTVLIPVENMAKNKIKKLEAAQNQLFSFADRMQNQPVLMDSSTRKTGSGLEALSGL